MSASKLRAKAQAFISVCFCDFFVLLQPLDRGTSICIFEGAGRQTGVSTQKIPVPSDEQLHLFNVIAFELRYFAEYLKLAIMINVRDSENRARNFPNSSLEVDSA